MRIMRADTYTSHGLTGSTTHPSIAFLMFPHEMQVWHYLEAFVNATSRMNWYAAAMKMCAI